TKTISDDHEPGVPGSQHSFELLKIMRQNRKQANVPGLVVTENHHLRVDMVCPPARPMQLIKRLHAWVLLELVCLVSQPARSGLAVGTMGAWSRRPHRTGELQPSPCLTSGRVYQFRIVVMFKQLILVQRED